MGSDRTCPLVEADRAFGVGGRTETGMGVQSTLAWAKAGSSTSRSAALRAELSA